MQGTTQGCRRGRPLTAWMDNIKTQTGLPVAAIKAARSFPGHQGRKAGHPFPFLFPLLPSSPPLPFFSFSLPFA